MSNVTVMRRGAPTTPDPDMTSGALYYYQREFTKWAAQRLLTVGAEQYDTGHGQKFESMSIGELVQALREELADIVNYTTMIDIQLQQWLIKQQNGEPA